MSRTFQTLTAALLFALAPLFASASLPSPSAQGELPLRPELFTTVEMRGWDLASYDDRIREAVISASAPGAGRALKRAAASALLERANFFRNQGVPTFYKYALGDYRHVLRFWPGNAEAKSKSAELVGIYEMLGRPVPQNGDVADRGVYPVELFVTTPEPLDLQPGKSYTLSGDILGRGAFVYEFDARAGQKLSAAFLQNQSGARRRGGAALFDISYVERRRGARNLQVPGSAGADFEVPITGKYQIRVYPKSGETHYDLKVGLDLSSKLQVQSSKLKARSS